MRAADQGGVWRRGSVEGKHVITIEGLGTSSHPHPLQERIAKLHGSQCGFCTPGIVMTLYALLRNAYDPATKTYRLSAEMVELEGALDGNLCRCTGYRPILDAAKSFVREDLGGVVDEGLAVEDATPTPVSSGDDKSTETDITVPLAPCGRSDCCRLPAPAPGTLTELAALGESGTGAYSFPQFSFKPYVPGTEMLFPAGLRRHIQHPIYFGNSERMWLRPTTLAQMLQIKHALPSANIVAGGSGAKHGNAVCVYVGDIDELRAFNVDEEAGQAVIGGSTPLSVVEQECFAWHKRLGGRGRALGAIAKQLRHLAGRQVIAHNPFFFLSLLLYSVCLCVCVCVQIQ